MRVDVDDDGGGLVTVVVRLDVEAAARTVWSEGSLPLTDLRDTGWAVTDPVRQPDGGAVITATKGFSQPDQLAAVLAQVSGPDGPLKGFQLERKKSFGNETWDLTGTIDLRGGLAFLSDPTLTAALGGYPLGYPPEVITQLTGGQPLESLVGINFATALPGKLGGNSGSVIDEQPPTTTTAPGTDPASVPDVGKARKLVTWTPTFADTNPTNVRAVSSESQLVPRLWRWLGLAVLALGACVLVYQVGFGLLERRRERRRVQRRLARRPATVSDTAPGGPEPEPDLDLDPHLEPAAYAPVPERRFQDPRTTRPRLHDAAELDEAGSDDHDPGLVRARTDTDGLVRARPIPAASPVLAAPAPVPPPRPAGGLRLVVIETAGVLFSVVDPVDELLVPYARARGSSLAASQINDWYVARIVGGLPAADFWAGLGVPGDPVLLDDGYARRYELAPDILDFLRQARGRGLEVTAVGEEVADWVQVFRQRYPLDDVVGGWISGADLGVRPPHPTLLAAAARSTGVPPGSTMVISRSTAMLDLARRRGSRTVQYAPTEATPAGDHPVLRSFASVGT